MTKRKISFAISFAFILLSMTAALASEEDFAFQESLKKANTFIKTYRHFEASDALQDAIKHGGAIHPSLHMRLAILYYGLGLVPEAIAQGEKAVTLAPSSKWYKYDLAKFYFVDKQFDKAEQQMTTLLKIDPGFTLGYYYLAELYLQKKEYDMAWLSLQRARKLSFQGRQLEEKLATLSSKPIENFKLDPNDNMLFRFIKFSTAEESSDALNKILTGQLFENIELELTKNQSSGTGFGLMMLSELQDEVADSLRDSPLYSPPAIVKTGADYRIMQRIMPFDPTSWERTLNRTPQTIPATEAKLITSTALTKGNNNDNNITVPLDSSKTETTRNTISTGAAGPKHKQLLSNRLAAVYAVENWKTTWAEQNVGEYLNAYSNNFAPNDGSKLEAWKNKRNKSLTAPEFIRLDIEDLLVETLNENQLSITFKQRYESDTYQDVVIKTLTMTKEASGWKIVKEREMRKLAP